MKDMLFGESIQGLKVTPRTLHYRDDDEEDSLKTLEFPMVNKL
jgi:hypothetical protein